MNSWERVEPGTPQAAWNDAAGYRVYRTTFTPPKFLQSTGGRIVFHALAGEAEVFFDGHRTVGTHTPVPGARSKPASPRRRRHEPDGHDPQPWGPTGFIGRVELLALTVSLATPDHIAGFDIRNH